MDINLLLISLGLTVGVISGYILKGSNLLYLIIGTFLIILFSILIKNKKLFIYFLIGFLLVNIQVGFNNVIGDYEFIEGKVIEEIGDNKYILLTSQYIKNNEVIKSRDRIYINYLGEEKFKLGTKIRFNSEIKDLRKNTNPKLYNEKLYFNSKEVFNKVLLKENEILNIDTKFNFIDKIKNYFEEYVTNSFNKLKEEDSKVLIALILGKDYILEREILDDFRDLGIAHLLAISGLHIGILFKFISFLLLKLGFNKRKANLTSLIIIFTYGTLINWPISILRGFLILSILEVSKTFHYPMKDIWALQLTYIMTLIIQPMSIFSVSFQLSFMAIGSLMLISKKIESSLEKIPLLNIIKDFISIQLGILPIQIYYFNNISIISPIANLFLIPIYSLVLILGFTLLLIPLPIIKGIISITLSFILNLTRFIESSLKSFLPLNIKSFSPDLIEIIGYYLILIIILNREKLRKIKLGTLYSLLSINIILSIMIGFNFLFNEELSLEFIDVGQGDAILIKDSKGKYLVDTGGELFGEFSIGKNITTPYLIKNGNLKLDSIFITHFHEDHSKALLDILEDIEIGKIFISYRPEDNELYKQILYKSKEKNIPLIELKAGDKLTTKGGLDITVLNPESNNYHRKMNENNLSLVLKLKYKNYNILLTGDMEKEIEEKLLEKDLVETIDIIKVPHHGSKTSSTEKFLDRIKPKISIFTVGRNNMFSHPNPEILERYSKSKIYRTDEDGMIKVKLRSESISIKFFNRESISRKLLILYFEIIFYFLTSSLLIGYNMKLKEDLTRTWR